MLAILGLDSGDLHTAFVAGLTAVVVTLLTQPFKEWLRLVVETRLHKNKADSDHLLAQRKALSAVISKHHGRLVDAADRFAHRMVKVEQHAPENWLDPKRPGSDGYFLDSTVYRFVILLNATEALEREGLVIDQRVGRAEDQRLIWYARAFRWSLTSANMFDGAEYDSDQATDHFLTDTLRDMARYRGPDIEELSFQEFRSQSKQNQVFAPALEFFSAIQPGQLRWDRLMVCRLITMGLLNEYGDDVQVSTQDWFDAVARSIENDRIAQNFAEEWLPRLRLKSVPIEGAMRKRLSS